jgi:hypothetical protein
VLILKVIAAYDDFCPEFNPAFAFPAYLCVPSAVSAVGFGFGCGFVALR